jgi:hypothetical protein
LSAAKLPVFTSSVNMFVYIKNAIKRCTALTTSTTFFTLSKEFRTCLNRYAKHLRGKLPGPTGPTGAASPVFKLAEGGEVDICYVINTAEYCTDTVPQLEEMIKAKIDLSYAESINFAQEVLVCMKRACMVKPLDVLSSREGHPFRSDNALASRHALSPPAPYTEPSRWTPSTR